MHNNFIHYNIQCGFVTLVNLFTVTAGMEGLTKQHVRARDQGTIGIPALIDCYGTILC